ncbi:MAG: glycosyl hydrolase family 95 catalytic domain-containing protein, partial [Terrimicrobiaceae bacterium]
RMREICQGCPPSYHEFPYPCPKPVGELAMRLPGDARNLRITQTLEIETAEITLLCTWENGLALSVVCYVANPENVFCLEWNLTGWNPGTRYSGDFAGVGPSQPVWFRLYRWADPTIENFGSEYFSRHRHPGLRATAGPTATPLPPPILERDGNLWSIRQDFPADSVFPEGFQCAMAPVSAEDMTVEAVPTGSLQTAMLHLLPSLTKGRLAIGVATTTESLEPLKWLRQLGENSFEHWRAGSTESARAFWDQSGIDLAGSSLERLWYASLHAKRCIYRADTVPPGLFLPSTIGDYALWHGDYHTNYNFQSIFLGDYESNHPELGDAYFQAMDFFLSIGRKIAREYFGCRGAFIQLSGYPTHAPDDIIGTVPMGRMAYMTGWASNMYWWRYQFSMDRDWLAARGYPALRDCALFYTDFLRRGDDGLFHAFPSNQGEDGFSGNAEDFRDRPQIIRHARYCLRNAMLASEVLDLDHDLAAQWRTILAHLAPEDGDPARVKLLYPDTRSESLAPEFYAFDGGLLPCGTADGQPPAYLDSDHESYRWYPG